MGMHTYFAAVLEGSRCGGVSMRFMGFVDDDDEEDEEDSHSYSTSLCFTSHETTTSRRPRPWGGVGEGEESEVLRSMTHFHFPLK
jgi:hypothetical protein